MKNVKTLTLILAAGLTVAFTSCDNEDADPILEDEASVATEAVIDSTAFGDSNMEAWTEIDEPQVPQTALDYIADNYPDDEIDHIWVDDEGGYVVLLEGGTAIVFDNAGSFIEEIQNAKKRRHGELTEIDIANLPTAVTDYLSVNYPDETIDEARTDENGSYHIVLENGPALVFDADGNFIEEKTRRRNRRKRNGRDHDEWTAIDISELPITTNDYITTTYPDATVLRAGVNEDGEFGVVLDNGMALLFSEDGSFIDEHNIAERFENEWTSIDQNDLPESVTDYFSTNYPDATILRVGVNEDGEYGLILNNGFALIFSVEGAFLEEEEIGYHHGRDCEEGEEGDDDEE